MQITQAFQNRDGFGLHSYYSKSCSTLTNNVAQNYPYFKATKSYLEKRSVYLHLQISTLLIEKLYESDKNLTGSLAIKMHFR